MRRFLTPVALALSIVFVGIFAGAGCKKFSGPESPQEESPAPAPTEDVVEGGPTTAEPEAKEPTFAEHATSAMRRIADGVRACITDYVAGMDMAQIDQGFLPVNLNQMDRACRAPAQLYKKESQVLIGRHTVLDAYFEHVAGFADAYLRLSFRFKQLGARERWKIVRDIQDYRGQVLEAATRIAEGAATVASWPAEEAPETEVAASDIDAATLSARAADLLRWLVERLPHLVEAYDTYAFRPADRQQAIFSFSFRYNYATTKRWFELGVRRFEALRCSDPDCARVREQLAPALEAATAVIEGYHGGIRFYRGDYFKRLDAAIPVQQELRKRLKDFKREVRRSRLLR